MASGSENPAVAAAPANLSEWHSQYLRHGPGYVLNLLEQGNTQDETLELMHAITRIVNGASPSVLEPLLDTDVSPSSCLRSDRAQALFLLGRRQQALQEFAELTSEPDCHPLALFRHASIKLLEDKYSEAESLLHRAIHGEKQSPYLFNNLASALLRQGKKRLALEALEAALQLDEDLASAQQMYRHLLLEIGELEPVLARGQKELEAEPENAKLRDKLARAYIDAGLPAEAIALCDSEYCPLLLRLEILLQCRRFHDVLTLLDAEKPLDSSRGTLLRAQCLLEIGHNRKVLALLSSKLDENANTATLLRARCLHELDEHGAALTELDRLLELEPTHPQALSLKANILLAVGRIDEAETLFCSPSQDQVTAALHLSRIRSSAVTEAHNTALRRLLDNHSLHYDIRAAAGFALAQHCDSEGEWQQSFEYLTRANALIAARHPFSSEAFAQELDDLEQSFDQGCFAEQAAPSKTHNNTYNNTYNCNSPTPVFIVGMPRSGTTLIEQILLCSPQLSSAGELDLAPRLWQSLRRLSTDAKTQNLGNEIQRQTLATQWLQRMQSCASQTAFVIDKLPLNFLYLGLIARLFPEARIIHVRRAPGAVALSNFQQNFRARHGAMAYAFDWEHIAAMMHAQSRIMGHWRQTLPLSIHEIQYEELVSDFGAQTAALFHYVGVEPVDASDFAHHAEAVRTASVLQVRQPLYASKMEHWRHYRPFMTHFEQAFGELG